MPIKRKVGRPKNAIVKPKLSPAELEEVHREFVMGARIRDIQRKHNLTSMNFFYRNAEENGWFAERDKFFQDVAKRELDNALSATLNSSDKIIDDISTIKKKAMDAIKSGMVSPQYFGETTKAWQSAVELERRIRIEGLQLSFIMEVAKILKKNIQDPITLSRIGDDLKNLFVTYQNKALPDVSDKDA